MREVEPFVRKLRLKRTRRFPHGRAGGASWIMVLTLFVIIFLGWTKVDGRCDFKSN